jgi:hypothetical protein
MRRMRPKRMDDRTDMAQIAVSAFVHASLACMENPPPGSPEEVKCERLIARARQFDTHYVKQLWKSLRRDE